MTYTPECEHEGAEPLGLPLPREDGAVIAQFICFECGERFTRQLKEYEGTKFDWLGDALPPQIITIEGETYRVWGTSKEIVVDCLDECPEMIVQHKKSRKVFKYKYEHDDERLTPL